MTNKQSPGEYAQIIRKAYRIIYENLSHYPDPMIHSYVLAYNKKLDVVEILRNICINDQITLQENPIWPKIENNENCVEYSHRLDHNEEYPKTLPDERIILDTFKTNSSIKDTVEFVEKIINGKNS